MLSGASRRWKITSIPGAATGIGAGRDRDLWHSEVAPENARRRLRDPHRDRDARTELPVVVHCFANEAFSVLSGPHLPYLLSPVMAGRGEDTVPSPLVGFDVDHRCFVDQVDVREVEDPPFTETA